MNKLITIELKVGIRTALADGTLVTNSPKHIASEHLYKAIAGNKISLISDDYVFAIAIFSLERDMKYIYTYDYQSESNWTSYTQNLTPDSYSNQEYVFEEECYFRICLKRSDGQDVTDYDANRASEMIRYEAIEEERKIKQFFKEEIKKTTEDILKHREGLLTFCILTDTHYTVNGTWEDTALNIEAVHKEVCFDEIVHMGDITDGITSAKITSDYVNRVLGDLKANHIPVRVAIGNHDTNYFRKNQERFTIEEQRKLYLMEDSRLSTPYYYVDYPEYNLRCMFLHSFNHDAPIRYGFEDETVEWVKGSLETMENGGNVIIFSHDAPFAELDFWSFSIRNGERLMDILEDYNAKDDYHILGYFYGHTHTDSVYDKCSFPLVSIGCNKCEYFEDKKPEGGVTPKRELDTVTQDLWDTLMLDIEEKKIYMIRFGAGDDRVIDCSKKKSVRKKLIEEKRRARKTKIWAHRGASGYAPENTIPSFALAIELGCDGIELDVHLTKDGIPVVIHDDTIDRVSDGRGYVREYTLEELRTFNYAKNFSAYGRVDIPTLEEVYHFLQDTEIIINLELKNHRYFYKGLEEKVLDIAKKYRLEDRIRYSSFNHYSMEFIKKLKNDVKTILLYRDGIIDIGAYASKYGAYAVQTEFNNIKYPGYMDKCRESGIAVHVWTVNEYEDIRTVAEAGADVVVTNYPDRAAKVIEQLSID